MVIAHIKKIIAICIIIIILISTVLFLKSFKTLDKDYLPQEKIEIPYEEADYREINESDSTTWFPENQIVGRASFSSHGKDYFVSDGCYSKLLMFNSFSVEAVLKDFPYDLYSPELNSNEIHKIEFCEWMQKWHYDFSNKSADIKEYYHFSPDFTDKDIKEVLTDIKEESDTVGSDTIQFLRYSEWGEYHEPEWYLILHYKKADGLYYAHYETVKFLRNDVGEHFITLKHSDKGQYYKLSDSCWEKIEKCLDDGKTSWK